MTSSSWAELIDERVSVRFWTKVERTNTCWLWSASKNEGGYGIFRLGHNCVLAHRLAWFMENGDFTPGLVMDHLCRVRNCVRADHLEQVPGVVNTMRGDGFPAAKAAQTHCIHGHEFTPENTIRISGGRRNCRSCKHRYEAARRLRMRAVA